MKLVFEDLRSYSEIEKAIFRQEKLRIVFRTDQNDKPRMDGVTELDIEITDTMTVAEAIFAIRGAFVRRPPFATLIGRTGIVPHGQALIKDLRFREPLMTRLKEQGDV